MFVRRMVHHHVHNDADISLLRLGNQTVEVGQGAVGWVDILVVRDVVAEIDLWRGIDGREPDAHRHQATGGSRDAG